MCLTKAKFKSAESRPEAAAAAATTYRANAEHSHLPMILGLSASLGAGEKKRDGGGGGDRGTKFIQEAVKHLKQVCCNMDSPTVLFPRGSDAESLAEFCPTIPDEELIPVPPRPDDEFRSAFGEFVENVVANLEGGDDIVVEIEKLGDVKLNKTIDKIIADASSSEIRVNAARYLKEFNKAFSLLKILRARDVVDYVAEAEELPFRAISGPRTTTLPRRDLSDVPFIRRAQTLWAEREEDLHRKATLVDSRDDNPILRRLKEILLDKFLKDRSARGIVLVEMRYSTKALIDFVLSDPALKDLGVRPVALVGQTEMSDFVVKENLKGYRSGDDNLLVATDIAQEGLDIPQCNFVIRYHFVSNEIGAMQAVGRARRKDSRCYLLVVEDSEEHRRDKKVRRFVKAMNAALTHHLLLVERGTWKTDVEAHQKKVHETMRKSLQKKAKEPQDPGRFVIVCGRCNARITGAYNVVKIEETNHHLVDDDDDDEFDAKIRRQFNHDQNETTVFCGKCKVNKLGIEVNYKQGSLYRGSWVALSAEGVKYVDETKGDNRAMPPFKFAWKKAPFVVRADSYKVGIDDFDIDDDDDCEYFVFSAPTSKLH